MINVFLIMLVVNFGDFEVFFLTKPEIHQTVFTSNQTFERFFNALKFSLAQNFNGFIKLTLNHYFIL